MTRENQPTVIHTDLGMCMSHAIRPNATTQRTAEYSTPTIEEKTTQRIQITVLDMKSPIPSTN
ncbi:MAG: hypothetical protein H5T41_02595 [Methanomassiliicoccales archaeon]|nr:hypothetical protein [Methanomassiliicoccales archaeon]